MMSILIKGIDLPEKENRMYMMELYADGHCSVAKVEDGECYELTIPSETEAVQIPYDVEDIVDDIVENHELYRKGGRIV